VWYQPACGCRCGSACPACPACPVEQQQQLGQQKQEVVSTTQSGTIFSGWFKEYLFVYTLLRQNVAAHNVYVTRT